MAKTCGIAALLILASSVVFHVATFIPAIPVSMEMAWPLPLATMAVYATMVFSLGRLRKKRAKALSDSGRAQSKLLRCVPLPLRIACKAAFIYGFINFMLFMVLSEGGGPSVENGEYVLQSHGHKIRDITKEEYQRFRAYEMRFFSSHCIIFSIIPMVYFLFVHPQLYQQASPSAKRQANNAVNGSRR